MLGLVYVFCFVFRFDTYVFVRVPGICCTGFFCWWCFLMFCRGVWFGESKLGFLRFGRLVCLSVSWWIIFYGPDWIIYFCCGLDY